MAFKIAVAPVGSCWAALSAFRRPPLNNTQMLVAARFRLHPLRDTASTRMITLALFGLLFGQAARGQASSQNKPPANTWVISGHVFAVTKAGDLKPARLASIYFLSGDVATQWYKELTVAIENHTRDLGDAQAFVKSALPDTDEDSSFLTSLPRPQHDRLLAIFRDDTDAYLSLLTEISQLKKDLVEVAASNHFERYSWNEDTMCAGSLLAYDLAFAATRKWRWEHRKWDALVSVKADEDGRFKITVPNGKFLIIARGRAGFNEAVWKFDGEPTPSLTLGEPVQACLSAK